MPASHMVFSHHLLFLGLDFVEDLPNPFCIKLLDPWIKTETKKNLHQRRLDFEGFLNVIASRLFFWKPFKRRKRGSILLASATNQTEVHTCQCTCASVKTMHIPRRRCKPLVGYELTNQASRGLTKFNNCKVRLI